MYRIRGVGGALMRYIVAGSYAVTYRVTDSSGNQAQQVNRTVNVLGVPPPGGEKYVSVTDETGALTVEIPQDWGSIEGQPIFGDGGSGARLLASADAEGFWAWQPGIYFYASRDAPYLAQNQLYQQTHDQSGNVICSDYVYSNYSDGLYSGLKEVYSGCESGGSITTITVFPEDESFVVILAVQTLSASDLEASNHIFATFKINSGFIPGGGN